jgi:hypothetical protein
MQPSDDLVIQIFFWTSAFLAVVEAMKASGWRVWAFGILGGVLVLVGAVWSWLKEVYPPLTGWITSIATNPQSWFLLFVLFLVLVSVTGRAKRKQSQGGKSTEAAELAALDKSLQGVIERVGKLEQLPDAATSEDHGKLVTTVVNLTKDTNARVDRLAPNPQIDRDFRRMMDFVVFQSTILMLDNLLKLAPNDMLAGPLQIGEGYLPKNAEALQFIEIIRDRMDPGTERRAAFERSMDHASNMAERQLEDTPKEQRPDGIDHLLLRKWIIAHLQCVHAIEFLKRQRAKAEQTLLNMRPELLKRYQELNP